jgi:hypothetical protein
MASAGVHWVARRLRRLAEQARDGVVLMGRAAWRGVHEVAFGSDDLTHAAAIAYYALLSFLPFLLLSMSVLGAFAGSPEARGDVLKFVLRYFPDPPDFVAQNLDAFWQTRIRLGIGGALGLLWASQGVFGAISTAVNHAWGVEQPRTFWGHRWFTLVMMGAAALHHRFPVRVDVPAAVDRDAGPQHQRQPGADATEDQGHGVGQSEDGDEEELGVEGLPAVHLLEFE